MLMHSDLNRIRKLLPRFLHGDLPKPEQGLIEAALREHPELVEELEQLELQDYYQSIEASIPGPATDLFDRIEEEIKTAATTVPPTSLRTRIAVGLRKAFGTPTLAWGMVAVQFLLISTLLINPQRRTTFTTLSDPAVARDGMVSLKLVFKEGVLETEMRQLLRQVGAEIVAGPSAEGLYVISLAPDQDAQQTLRILKRSTHVRFAAIAL